MGSTQHPKKANEADGRGGSPWAQDQGPELTEDERAEAGPSQDISLPT